MKKIKLVSEFKRDLKRVRKRGKQLFRLDEVIKQLAVNKPLAAKYRPHKLSGNYGNKMECHIEPDWLLIYEYEKEYLVLYRTGTHSDLFE